MYVIKKREYQLRVETRLQKDQRRRWTGMREREICDKNPSTKKNISYYCNRSLSSVFSYIKVFQQAVRRYYIIQIDRLLVNY